MTGPARAEFAPKLLDGQELLLTGAAGGVGGAVADLRQADAAEHLVQAALQVHGRRMGGHRVPACGSKVRAMTPVPASPTPA